jgi:hypothetical protein
VKTMASDHTDIARLNARLALLIVALLLVAALPLLTAGAMLARAVLLPPFPSTRFLSFQGVDGAGKCDDYSVAHGKHVLMCTGHLAAISWFTIQDQETTAVLWCVNRASEFHFAEPHLTRLGPLQIGKYPIVPRDWNLCADLLPVQTGVYFELLLDH